MPVRKSDFTARSPYGMDQLSAVGGKVPYVVDTTVGKAFRCEVAATGSNRYSRPIFNDDSGQWQKSGRISIAGKFRLGVGYAANVNAEQDLLRLDNYVHTDGPQEHIALCFRKDGTACVATQFNNEWKPVIAGFKIPEGRWFDVRLTATLAPQGSIELKLDGATYTVNNLQTAPPLSRYFTRVRYGVVSCPATEKDQRVVHVTNLSVT